ncbi:MAG: hypothetical protein JNK64_17240 [Myxococcales bacterium]|nr:hypothetical protein [Myxococcales bacterium]
MSDRGRDKDTERSRDPYIAGGSFQASSDPLAHGHSAVTLLSGGGFGLPRISVMAREALATGEYGPARHAAMTWYTNKPYLEELARSLDPEDDMVARAQALLDEMAPLEPRLPNLVELAFGLEQSAKARAHWLARLGRAESHAATPAAAPAIPEVRSPLRPENIKPELGWSEIAAGALGGVGVGWAALSHESADPLQRGVADVIDHALDSPEYSAGFLVGGIGGASAALSDSQQSVVDLAKLVYDLLAARFRGGDLGMLKALRDKVMGLIGAGKQIPGALKALADRWNDGSDPYAQGAFQGTVVGYIATQVAIIIVSSMTVPVVGPYADVVAALKLVTSPVEGIVEVAAAARAARGVGAMTRAEHAVDDVAAGERTAARAAPAAGGAEHAGAAGAPRLGSTFDDVLSQPGGVGPPMDDVAPHSTVLEPFVGDSLESARQLAREHPDAQVVAAEARFMPSAEDIGRFRAEGGEFLAERFAESLPPSSVEKIYVRYPIPHDKGLENISATFLQRLEKELAAGVPRREAVVRATQGLSDEVESITNLGPHALEKLVPGGTMEVIYWESEVFAEVRQLVGRRYVEPHTGQRFTIELEAPPTSIRRDTLPNSGFGIPREVEVVTRLTLRKVGLS